MSDRQLLELAAKAAGIVLKRSRLDDPLNRDMLVEASDKHHSSLQGWNPLTDDGDALRLAVAVPIGLHICRGYVIVNGDQIPTFNDPARVRRAIVRAAAAIGAPA